jgi:hypothetical protein
MICFRCAPTAMSEEDRDAFNRNAVSELQRDGRVFPTGTTWQDKAAIRCAFDNWSTTKDDVRILQEAVREIGDGLLANLPGKNL